MSFSSWCSLFWVYDAFEEHLLPSHYKFYLLQPGNGSVGLFVSRETWHKKCARAATGATPRTPKNPVFGPAKKSSLPPAKMCKKWGFWAKKRAFSVNLCTILHKNDLFFADIAPRYRAASPSGKNPPIYTVLNAAFSAPGPPRLWHRGGTPVPDALPRAPDTRFAKNTKNVFSQNTDDGDRISPMTFSII